jgi:hypothetical protein
MEGNDLPARYAELVRALQAMIDSLERKCA